MSVYCGASFGGGQGYTDTCGKEEYGAGTPLAQCKQCMRLEIFKLKAENESLRADIRKITRERGRLTLENEKLKVEMSSAQRDIYSLGIDAKRYRWIKNNAAVTLRKTVYYMSGTSYIGTIYPNQSDLDLAIDTAISSTESP